MTDQRPRDPSGRPPVGASKQRLLAAAGELFAERGYERTTLRDVGERAGVDPALVARHFGGKAGLYLAALKAERGEVPPADLLDPDRLRAVLTRLGTRGSGPVLQAVVRAAEAPEVAAAAREELSARLVDPLEARLRADGVDRPRLRAEVAVAAFAGVVLGRGGGALDGLAAAEPEELVELVAGLLAGVARG